MITLELEDRITVSDGIERERGAALHGLDRDRRTLSRIIGFEDGKNLRFVANGESWERVRPNSIGAVMIKDHRRKGPNICAKELERCAGQEEQSYLEGS